MPRLTLSSWPNIASGDRETLVLLELLILPDWVPPHSFRDYSTCEFGWKIFYGIVRLGLENTDFECSLFGGSKSLDFFAKPSYNHKAFGVQSSSWCGACQLNSCIRRKARKVGFLSSLICWWSFMKSSSEIDPCLACGPGCCAAVGKLVNRLWR